MLKERLNGTVIHIHPHGERILGIQLEDAFAAPAELHARAVDGHDLLETVVAEDELFQSEDEFDGDRMRLPHREIEDELREIVEGRRELALPLRLERALRLAMAQRLQLAHRLGEDMPLPQRQHARERQAVHPALLPRRVVLLAVRHPHPADEDVPSLVRDDLRRIEVKAVIELLEPPMHQHLHRIH